MGGKLTRERAAQKQASRDRDAEDLRSGKKTLEQVRRENSLFYGAKIVVHYGQHKRPR